jgi:hypothetical protein
MPTLFQTFGTLFLLAGACLPAAGQTEVTPLGATPSFDDIVQPYYLRYYNALLTHAEWALNPPGSLFSFGGSYSLLQSGRPLDNVLADWHQPNADLTLGSQLLTNATPIYEQFLVDGVRYGWHKGTSSGTIWYGQSQNPAQELTGLYQRQQTAGFSYAFTPNDFHSVGVSLMPYGSKVNGGFDRSMMMGQFYQGGESANGSSYGVSLGLGYDPTGSGLSQGSSDFGSRSALKALASYTSEGVNLSLNSHIMGLDFGPTSGINDLRGTQFTSFLGTDHLTDKLDWQESVNISDIGMGTGKGTYASDLTHTLRYRGQGYFLQGSLEQLRSDSPGSTLKADSLFLLGSGSLGAVQLNGQARYTRRNNDGNQLELGLGTSFPVNDVLSLQFQENLNSSDGQANSRTDFTTNAGASLHLGEIGQVQVGYFRQDSLRNSVFYNASRDYFLLSTSLNLTGNVQLQANLNQGYKSVAIHWQADQHDEFVLEHRSFNQANRFTYADYTSIPLGEVTTLIWHGSWGGPMEKEFRRRLTGRVFVAVQASTPDDGPALSLANVTVLVDDARAQTTARGVANFAGLAAGSHRVRLSGGGLGPEFEPDGPVEQEVDVQPGRLARLNFHLKATGRLEVLTFNDQENARGLDGAEYVPLAGVRMSMGALGNQTSSAEGKVLLEKLAGGNYTIALDRGSLEPGMELTTAESVSLQIVPGHTSRVVFGARGFGQLDLQLLESQPGGGTRPVVGMGVRSRELRIGVTDPQGHFRLRAPAGRNSLALELGNRYYLQSGSLTPTVGVNKTTSASCLLTRYARLHLAVVGSSDPRGSAISLSGPNGKKFPTVFLGPTGTYDFSNLRCGTYKVQLEGDSLPEGFEAVNPARTFELAPGELKQLQFHFKPTTPSLHSAAPQGEAGPTETNLEDNKCIVPCS